MADYTPTTDFSAKDSLPTGDANKIIKGSDFDTEFEAIETAIATKADGAVGVDVQAYDADTAKLDIEQSWSAQQVPFDGTLTDGATINWDADTNGQIVSVTLAGNRALAAPTNVLENACYLLRVTQDATGSRTLTWNAAYKFAGGADPVLSTTANAVDIFTFIGGSSNVLYCIGQAKGLA